MITSHVEELLEKYNAGLAAYKQRNWDEAIRFFTEALKVKPDDGPSQLYLERAQEFKADPPADDWDGVFVMKTK